MQGVSVYETNKLYKICEDSLKDDDSTGGDGMAGMVTTASITDKVFSPFWFELSHISCIISFSHSTLKVLLMELCKLLPIEFDTKSRGSWD